MSLEFFRLNYGKFKLSYDKQLGKEKTSTKQPILNLMDSLFVENEEEVKKTFLLY